MARMVAKTLILVRVTRSFKENLSQKIFFIKRRSFAPKNHISKTRASRYRCYASFALELHCLGH